MKRREDIIVELEAHLSPARAKELAAIVEREAASLCSESTHSFTTTVLDGSVKLTASYSALPDGSGTLTLTTDAVREEQRVLAREHASMLESEEDAANLLTQAFVVALTHWAVIPEES